MKIALIVLASLVVLVLLVGFGGIRWMTRMPGRSHQGPLPPLTTEESRTAAGLRGHLNVLAVSIGERNLQKHYALQQSAQYIEDQLAALGYDVQRQAYTSRGNTVENVYAVLPGSGDGDRVFVIGAHYDTVPGCPGAGDNGTGVAALLELARLLRGRPPGQTLHLVAFVNEESPYHHTEDHGARRYAQKLVADGAHVSGMISLETMGYFSDEPGSQKYPSPVGYFYPDTGDFIGFVGNVASRSLVSDAVQSFRRHAAFPSQGGALPGNIPGIGWSDHSAFWDIGVPAIMVTDTAPFRFPYYHTPQDTPDKIDADRLARVVMGLVGVTQDVAGDRP